MSPIFLLFYSSFVFFVSFASASPHPLSERTLIGSGYEVLSNICELGGGRNREEGGRNWGIGGESEIFFLNFKF